MNDGLVRANDPDTFSAEYGAEPVGDPGIGNDLRHFRQRQNRSKRNFTELGAIYIE